MDASNKLYQDLQNEKLNVQEFNKNIDEYISSITENAVTTTYRLQVISIQCLQLLYANYFDQIPQLGYDFSYGNIIKSCVSNFKNAKQEFRDLNLICANQILEKIDCTERIIQEVKVAIQSKNALQKVYSIKLLESTADKCDDQQLQAIRKIIQTAQSDTNQEVRKETEILQQIIDNCEPVLKSQRQSTRSMKSSKVNIQQSQSYQTKQNSFNKSRKQQNKDSLFPTPTDDDRQAQDQPFSIVPSVPTSYLPYKPTYLYDISIQNIIQENDKVLNELYDQLQEQDIQAINQILNKMDQQVQTQLQNQDWLQQMQALQLIFKVSLIDNQCLNTNISQVFIKHITQWLKDPNISQMFTSLRSTLSRECLIIIELLIQRYGSKLQQFIQNNIINFISLISKKGVYFQCQSISILKTIIVHQDQQYNKQLFNQLINQFKSSRIPQTKAYILDLILMIIIVNACMPTFEPLSSNELKNIIQQSVKDANGILRHTTRVFINVCNQIYEYDNILQGKDAELLTEEQYMQCGYNTYQSKVLINIQDREFVQLYLKSASCNQQINISFVPQITFYRYSLNYNINFDIYYTNMEEYGREVTLEEQIYAASNNIQAQFQQTGQISNIFDNQSDYQYLNDDDEIKATVEDTVRQLQHNNNIQTTQNTNKQDQTYNNTFNSFNDIPTSKQRNTTQNIQQQHQVLLQTSQTSNINKLIQLQDLNNDIQQIMLLLSEDKLKQQQLQQIVSNCIKILQRNENEDNQLQILNLLMQILLIEQNWSEKLIFQIISTLINEFNYSQQIKQQTDQILKLIVQTCDKKAVLTVLVQIYQQKVNLLYSNVTLRLISLVIKQFDYNNLLPYIKPLMKQLIDQFDSEDIYLRKTAVNLFIDFYLILNDKFLPYVNQLTDKQLLLVIERIKKMKNKTQN